MDRRGEAARRGCTDGRPGVGGRSAPTLGGGESAQEGRESGALRCAPLRAAAWREQQQQAQMLMQAMAAQGVLHAGIAPASSSTAAQSSSMGRWDQIQEAPAQPVVAVYAVPVSAPAPMRRPRARCIWNQSRLRPMWPCSVLWPLWHRRPSSSSSSATLAPRPGPGRGSPTHGRGGGAGRRSPCIHPISVSLLRLMRPRIPSGRRGGSSHALLREVRRSEARRVSGLPRQPLLPSTSLGRGDFLPSSSSAHPLPLSPVSISVIGPRGSSGVAQPFDDRPPSAAATRRFWPSFILPSLHLSVREAGASQQWRPSLPPLLPSLSLLRCATTPLSVASFLRLFPFHCLPLPLCPSTRPTSLDKETVATRTALVSTAG